MSFLGFTHESIPGVVSSEIKSDIDHPSSEFSVFDQETGTATTRLKGFGLFQKVEPISAVLKSLPEHDAIIEGIKATFEKMTQDCPKESYQASTACVVIFNPKTNIIYIASTGDCGMALIYKNSATQAFYLEEFPRHRHLLNDPHQRIRKDVQGFGKSHITHYLTYQENYPRRIAAQPNIEWHILPKRSEDFDIDLVVFSKALLDIFRSKQDRFKLYEELWRIAAPQDRSDKLANTINNIIHERWKRSEYSESEYSENVAVSYASQINSKHNQTPRLWAIFEGIGTITPEMPRYLAQNFLPVLSHYLDPKVASEAKKTQGSEEKTVIEVKWSDRISSSSCFDFDFRKESGLILDYHRCIAEYLANYHYSALEHRGSKTSITYHDGLFIVSTITNYDVCKFAGKEYKTIYQAQLEVVESNSSRIPTHACFTLDSKGQDILNKSWKSLTAPIVKDFGGKEVLVRYNLVQIALIKMRWISGKQARSVPSQEIEENNDVWSIQLSSQQKEEVIQMVRASGGGESTPQQILDIKWKEQPAVFLNFFSFIDYDGFFKELSYFPELHALHDSLRDYRLNCFCFPAAMRHKQVLALGDFIAKLENRFYPIDNPYDKIQTFIRKDGSSFIEAWDALLEQIKKEVSFLEFIISYLPENKLIPKILTSKGNDIGPYYSKFKSVLTTIFCCPCRCDTYLRFDQAKESCGSLSAESIPAQLQDDSDSHLEAKIAQPSARLTF